MNVYHLESNCLLNSTTGVYKLQVKVYLFQRVHVMKPASAVKNVSIILFQFRWVKLQPLGQGTRLPSCPQKVCLREYQARPQGLVFGRDLIQES